MERHRSRHHRRCQTKHARRRNFPVHRGGPQLLRTPASCCQAGPTYPPSPRVNRATPFHLSSCPRGLAAGQEAFVVDPMTGGPTPAAAAASAARPPLTVLPLIALIFYDVSGGPFGIEDSVRCGGGALLPVAGFLVLPLLWSLPEALITAELASSFPTNGGYVTWVSAAFGPFWAFQEGFWKWASGTLDNALYPVLFLDYFRSSLLPSRPLSASYSSSPSFLSLRSLYIMALTAALTYLNYRGLHLVGLSALALAAFSLSPFVALAVLSLPKIRPARWLSVDARNINLRGYFNSMFWNLNYWDKASTLAGEVEEPRRTFPKAVFGAVGLVVVSYLVPLLAGTGALPTETAAEWTDGYFSEVGRRIGGPWLRTWIQAAAAMSNMGLFEAEMSSDSFQLLGMAEMGMIPAIFAYRSKYGTPTFSILCSATGVVILSCMSFQEIIEFLNFLYAMGMLLVFATFIKLRIKSPDLHRPYKIPLGTFGVVAMCIPAIVLLLVVMCLASIRTLIVSGSVMVVGVILYHANEHMKRNNWVEFLSPAVPESDISFHGAARKSENADVEDVQASLLAGNSSSEKQPHERQNDLEEVAKVE